MLAFATREQYTVQLGQKNWQDFSSILAYFGKIGIVLKDCGQGSLNFVGHNVDLQNVSKSLYNFRFSKKLVLGNDSDSRKSPNIFGKSESFKEDIRRRAIRVAPFKINLFASFHGISDKVVSITSALEK